jgi:ferredoxin
MNRLKVDRDLCIGSGNCVYFAPAVFSLDDDGISAVGSDQEALAGVKGMSEEDLATVVAQCPTGAISIEED